jgi:hypothetical protein
MRFLLYWKRIETHRPSAALDRHGTVRALWTSNIRLEGDEKKN